MISLKKRHHVFTTTETKTKFKVRNLTTKYPKTPKVSKDKMCTLSSVQRKQNSKTNSRG